MRASDVERAGTAGHPRAIENAFRRTEMFSRSIGAHAGALGSLALATRSRLVLDIIAFGAGLGSYEQALVRARGGVLEPERLTWLRELGRVSYQFAGDRDRAEIALAFYEAAFARRTRLGFRRVDSQTYLEALLYVRGPDAVTAELPRHAHVGAGEVACMRADVIAAHHGAGSQQWLATVNAELLGPHGLQPIAIADGDGPMFDRIGVVGSPKAVDGPLVTVIMTTFRRRSEIRMAVRSILDQTWKSLELIIVDDASGPEFDDVLDEIAGWDARVSVLRMPTNGGAYPARNAALGVARGEFVTFQDDDDWSHPERIERQVRPLLKDPDVVSTMGDCVRATEHLSFRYRGARAVMPNASSIMFRSGCMKQVGPYDSVRKAADTEYIERARVTVDGKYVHIDEPLSIVRLSAASLSRSDFAVGWRHPARSEYRESYREYHERIRWGLEAPPRAGVERRFPAPRYMLNATDSQHLPRRFDLVVVSDLRFADRGDDIAIDMVRRAVASGLTVGVAHVLDLTLSCDVRRPLAHAFRELLYDGSVSRLLPTDTIDVTTLMVDDAGQLEFISDEPWPWTVGSARLIARSLPAEESDESTWSMADVTAAIAGIFSPARTSWLAPDERLRTALARHGHDAAQVDLRALGLSKPMMIRRRPVQGPARIGAALRPAAEEQEGLGAWTVGVLQATEGDVRAFAAAGARSRQTLGWPATWLTYGPADISFMDFLYQLDFYVLFEQEFNALDCVLPALRAASSGCVVIADAALEPHLGEAAIYCDGDEAAATVARLSVDPAAYSAQVERARLWCEGLERGTDDSSLIRRLCVVESSQ